MIKKTTQLNRGFTILFASLIGSLVMQIGLAILGVTIMQINLASAGRESQYAFYAADTGTECALYLNYGGGNPGALDADICSEGVFPQSSSGEVCTDNGDGGTYSYQCNSNVLNNDDGVDAFSYSNDDDGNRVTSFNVFDTVSDVCFKVYVTKRADNTTSIESRGYSTCDDDNPNRFERAINTNF